MGEENDKAKYYIKNQTSNYEVKISDKDEQLLFASTNNLEKRVDTSSGYNPLTPGIQKSDTNTLYSIEATRLKYVQKLLKEKIENGIATDVLQPRDSAGITYIRAKETNQTGNGIRHKFLNASRISASFTAAKSIKRERENENNKKIEDIKSYQKEESLAEPLNNADTKDDIPKLSNNVKSNTSQQVQYVRDDDEKINQSVNKSDKVFSLTKEHFVKNPNESLIQMSSAMAQNTDPKVGNQTFESRIEQENSEPGEADLMEAANFGLQAMRKLYYIQEPKLYSLGKN